MKQNVKWGIFPTYYWGYEITESNKKFPWFVWQESCEIWTQISSVCVRKCVCKCVDIWSEIISLSLLQRTLKSVEMEAILLHPLDFGPSFYDPYSLFSTIPAPAKSELLVFHNMLQTPLKAADLIWLDHSESIKASTFAWATLLTLVPHFLPCKALRRAATTDDDPEAPITELKLVNNAWVFHVFIHMLDGYLNLAVRCDNLSYSFSKKTMSILFPLLNHRYKHI